MTTASATKRAASPKTTGRRLRGFDRVRTPGAAWETDPLIALDHLADRVRNRSVLKHVHQDEGVGGQRRSSMSSASPARREPATSSAGKAWRMRPEVATS